MTRSTLRLVIATIDSLCALGKVEAYDVRAVEPCSSRPTREILVKSRVVHSIIQPFDVDTSVRSTRRTRALEGMLQNSCAARLSQWRKSTGRDSSSIPLYQYLAHAST